MSFAREIPALSPKRNQTSSLLHESPATAPPSSASRPTEPRDNETHHQVLKEITVHDIDPGRFAIGSWKNVVMVSWESAADGAAVERLAAVSTAMAAAEPNARRSTVHIIANGAGLPTPEARNGFVDLMKEHADRLVCVAVVVGGSGFLASAMRSLITGMRWLSPRSFDFRLHGSLDAVLKWLPAEHLAKTGEQLDADHLEQVLNAWTKRSNDTPAP